MCLPDVALMTICATLAVDSDLWSQAPQQWDQSHQIGCKFADTDIVTTIAVDANLRRNIQQLDATEFEEDDAEQLEEHAEHSDTERP